MTSYADLSAVLCTRAKTIRGFGIINVEGGKRPVAAVALTFTDSRNSRRWPWPPCAMIPLRRIQTLQIGAVFWPLLCDAMKKDELMPHCCDTCRRSDISKTFYSLLGDENWLVEELDARGASAVIPPKANRKYQRDYDADAYK
ncbi:MAG: hypothetical protein U0934_02260 [Pseudotabrizicola sp.]|uniref:hypothetical protein n=1 Tax=Pseudotabrizicola sp. TaxID=2939647 RepID=UPI00271E03E9|nr:hypothetical protein [Pseudotabrizicola sp.]MDO8881374.1 hypothetical protein [Pseudotabrizicola sp.]MDP2080832.1 hypothetical protein [Pseudotabrizicola sp.]MDZ7572766.1 hypothetical protein [Pseudotabrizicola sp.]